MANELFYKVMVQAFCYLGVIIFSIACIAFTMRGFFWTYLKVRTSFGKYVLVKIRSPLRDYFKIGWIQGGFLHYKTKDEEGKFTIRLTIDNSKKYFYRSLGVMWVDVDEEKNSLALTDYNEVEGFDAKKHDELYTRCIMRPSVLDNQQKIMILLLIVVMVMVIGCLYLSFHNYDVLNKLPVYLNGISQSVESIRGSVSVSPTPI